MSVRNFNSKVVFTSGNNYLHRMKSVSKLTFLLAALALPGVASAVGSNPYSSIVERNPFGLLPPPAPVTAEVVTPPSNVKLTGISTLFGGKKAMLMVTESGPGKLPTYMSLVEGEQNGQITCTEINVEEGVVKIKNNGRNETLNFKDNGLVSAPTPVPPPGQPPQNFQPPPGAMPQPGAPVPAPAAAGGIGNVSGAVPQPGVAPANPGGLRSIPSRTRRTGAVVPQAGAAVPQAVNQQDEAVAAALLLEAARAKQKAGDPPLPPPSPAMQQALDTPAQ
ncbi:MAG: hypothetical protein RLZZ350_79 [Verrucomicrobiota bacterium]